MTRGRIGFFLGVIGLFWVFFIDSNLYAQGQDSLAAELDQCLTGLKNAYVDINSIKGFFTQEKNLPGLSAPLLSKGAFYFRRPGYLRWEYTRPLWSRLEISDGLISGWVGDRQNPQKQPQADLKVAKLAALQAMAWMSLDVEFIEKNSVIELTSKEPLRLTAYSKDLRANRESQKVEADFASDGITVEKICLSGSDSSLCLTFSEVAFNVSD
jgi:outer membrane lipoprotein-sorting protein